MSTGREPLAVRSYWTQVEAAIKKWQDGIQQQQELLVLWAPVPCMYMPRNLPESQGPPTLAISLP